MTGTQSDLASIIQDVFYPHPIERVWSALTRAESIAQWLMPNDFMPVPGHRFTMHAPPIPALNFDGTVQCEVVTLEPPAYLVHTWCGAGLESLVSYRLESAEQDGIAGTRLHFEHSGFDLGTPVGQFGYSGLSQGWPGILSQRLPAVLASLEA